MIVEPNILDMNIVQTILSEAETGEAKERKRQAFKAYEIYSGNVQPYVERELQRTRPETWETYTVSDVSVSSIIVNKLSKAYRTDPRREIEEDPNDEKSRRYNQILKEAGALRQLKEFDQIVNLHRYGLFWVNYHEPSEAYQFMSLAPYEFFFIRDKDSGKLVTVGLKMVDTTDTAGANMPGSILEGDGHSNLLAEGQADSGGQSQVYALWNSTNHVVVRIEERTIEQDDGSRQVKKDVTFVPLKDNPTNENKLGVIPFILKSRDNSVDLPTVNPITEQTIKYNALKSELYTAANIQGTSIQVLSYSESLVGKMDNMKQGLTVVTELIQPDDPDKPRSDTSFISPNPDLTGQMSTYQDYKEEILEQQGINVSTIKDNKFSSGFERLVAAADVQDIIEENQQTLYAPMEQEIFEIVKRWEVLLNTQSVFSEEDTIHITYEKPKVLITDKETLDNIEKRLSLGLIEKWEALTMLDPNMSEEDAKLKLARIELEKNGVATRFMNGVQQDRSIERLDAQLDQNPDSEME